MKVINAEKIFKIGEEVSDVLKENKVLNRTLLTIYGDEEWFKKIDEDIFYKLKNRGVIDKEKEFIPSEDEILLEFENLNFEIKKEKPRKS